MAHKKIITIGFSIGSDMAEYCSFDSDISLLDWDIIMFRPDIGDYIYWGQDDFEGCPSLSDQSSFKLKAQTEHWRREIRSAVAVGKLVVVFMTDLVKVFIATGEKEYSGTGRNQKTTKIVTSYDNYCSVPVVFDLINAKGKEIKLAAKNSESISSYWNEFSKDSSYKVLIKGEGTPCLLTKHGDKVVGTIHRSIDSTGALICLPDINLYQDSFFDEDDGYTSQGVEFASRLIKEIVSLDKSIRRIGELTPEPDWAKAEKYRLRKESIVLAELYKVEGVIERYSYKKEKILDDMKDLTRLRNLLYEKGKPLEYAILDALKIIGFNVSQFDNGESEFDAIFESSEGRLIGEAEGKDNKAINIDKLRQLALNIHEDLEQEGVKEPAKAVLFGNPYRLQPIEERLEPFTTKCLSAAQISATALVVTSDLYDIAKYLKDNRDVRFAKQCRKALLNTIGRVVFPPLPG